MKFAIILPVYNHLDYTKITLKELSGALDVTMDDEFSIVLVDDGSTDGTSDWVKSQYPGVILLSGDGNLWWSGGVNMGASYAIQTLNADYLILWNNDIQVEEGYFDELVRITSEMDDPVVIGSKIYVADQPGLVWSAGGYFNPKSGQNGMYGYFELDTDELNRIRDVDWATGMGTIIPRQVVESIGYWDQVNFPQYHGDTDFTYRAKLAGFPVRVYPSLKMFNHVENTGIEHQGNFRNLIRLMTDIRSKSNLQKNLLFLRKYKRSVRAYLPLVWFYLKIIGGFIKWKLLHLFGIRKKNT